MLVRWTSLINASAPSTAPARRRPAVTGSRQPSPAAAAAPGDHGPGKGDSVRLAVVVGALGVVFGDIGTSPIYTLQTVFNPADPHPVPVSTGNVYGVVSLVFWSVM